MTPALLPLLEDLVGWVRSHPRLLVGLGVASVVMFGAGLLLVPVIVARMPSDYFLSDRPRTDRWRRAHPVLRVLLHVGKNALGVVLVLAGVAMLVLPGQGVLTILMGLGLLDFPGKRRLELALVRTPPVRATLDWLRRRAGRPPLEIP